MRIVLVWREGKALSIFDGILLYFYSAIERRFIDAEKQRHGRVRAREIRTSGTRTRYLKIKNYQQFPDHT